MNQPEPMHRSLNSLVTEIEKGVVKIPQFQREFVWERPACAKLLDSILRGFPIGTFIFWKTREQLRSVRNIGHLPLARVPDGDFAEQVLDGQQRLTCLYAAAKGAVVARTRDGKARDDHFADIFVDLDANTDSDESIVTLEARGSIVGESSDGRSIRFNDLLSGPIKLFMNLSENRATRAQLFRQTIHSYQFPIVMLREAPLDIATEVFTRINEGGKKLTSFEIMVAKTFQMPDAKGKGGFELDTEFRSLTKRLASVEYETLDSASVLQLVSVLISGECRKSDILKLNPDRFRTTWPLARDSIEHACDYMRSAFGAKAARLLPYATLIIPFAFYFARRGMKQPTMPHAAWLSEFFWRAALSGRYGSSSESKVAADCRLVAKLIEGATPAQVAPVAISAEAVDQRGYFSTSRGFIRACLCMLVLQSPKSFALNHNVVVDNDWLKQANSKNFHHFFPKSHLRKCGEDHRRINHIANITIVDDYLNKRQIGAKAPSVYLKLFSENKSLSKSLATHLIDLKADGVLTDDFDRFYLNRCASIAAALRKLVPIRDVDAQAGTIDDTSEDAPPLEGTTMAEDTDEE
ncbi:MAG: DUF262 domain-containing protein [Planctomycetota bacterium]